ncbi:Omp28-related outer membrane protein [Lewinella cohaerens]|uniref:Omp28-related outer membrane protein n=1 Tax=Lewinella cohaerens TaxID=70995 RepID=UPI00036D0450|nr:Omp28-related outer membrane protein [Lewinella cohaerens]
MRKLLLLALACAPIFLLAQAQRTVLIEHFTNASCPPCEAQNPAFNALIRANPDKVISVKYQAPFPGFDPMNQQNPGEVNTRGDYYGLSGVPTAWMDGFTGDNDYGGGIGDWNITATSGYAGGPYGHNQAVFDYAADQATPISMVLTHELNEDATELTVNVAITNESTEDFTMADGRLHVVLVERDIVFPSPPGSTGEFEFQDVMRKMYPNAEGTNLTTIAAGATYETTITGAIPDYIYGLNEMRVIAFVQDHTSKEVWQTAYTEPQEIANAIDAGFGGNLTADPVGLCGATITPIVEFVNGGTVDITQATVNALINGSVVGTVEYAETLAPGETTTLTFDEIILAESNNELTFDIAEVNNGVGIDINGLNNSTAAVSYGSLSDTPIGTELMEDNESYNAIYPETGLVTPGIPLGEFGGNSFVVYAAADLPAGGDGGPIGGYGTSDRSIFINFYQWNPSGTAPSASLTYQKIDLTSATTPALMFDRASASYLGDGVSGDRLQILVSTDCAASFDVVWDAAGADLNTAPASDPFYIPSAGDWATETIDLSAYAGQEINVQFKAFSAWGNNLFLDNINVSNFVATEELTEVTEISLFPNPVKEMMKVDFTLAEASQLQVEVFNATGQRVQQLGVANYGAGRNQINIDAAQLSNGMYFLRMFNADRELNRRFIVQH